jgi:hypothetical protein
MKDGGSVFPFWDNSGSGSGGLTVRDYFAGQALVGLARNAGGVDAVKERAAKAYAYADAMLAEREKVE